mmetsp:Transcript_45644/g.143311  ORF Transcript_45644/g.143311 Transcript_45644/m.143311 type:complete len:235 (+) Transcript_45644:1429-2133(+)
MLGELGLNTGELGSKGLAKRRPPLAIPALHSPLLAASSGDEDSADCNWTSPFGFFFSGVLNSNCDWLNCVFESEIVSICFHSRPQATYDDEKPASRVRYLYTSDSGVELKSPARMMGIQPIEDLLSEDVDSSSAAFTRARACAIFNSSYVGSQNRCAFARHIQHLFTLLDLRGRSIVSSATLCVAKSGCPSTCCPPPASGSLSNSIELTDMHSKAVDLKKVAHPSNFAGLLRCL